MNLFNIAFRNIKKSIRDYSIYFITLVIAIAIFYLFNSIDSQTAMLKLNESTKEIVQTLINFLSYVSVFVAIVLGFLIVYANNFIIKRRKKEIGVYLTLGMSNFRVSMILVLETMMVGIISLVVGTILGIGLSQLVSVFTAKLFEADMTSFAFVFSADALVKTIINFGVIYFIVMIFNVISLNRFKLIDLLYAKSKNEKIKIKNSWLIFFLFIISLVLIGYAYSLLYDNALLNGGQDFIVMLISGALGTFLFFLSVSGFLLKVVSLSKRLYYRGLNIFILKQVNNKINTHVVSTTVISLMLLLTIGILSSSLSLANAMNASFRNNTPYDYSAIGFENNEVLNLRQEAAYKDITSEDYLFNYVYFDDLSMGDFIYEGNELYDEMDLLFQTKMPAIKESDYNKLMEMANNEKQKVDLADNRYILVATMPMSLDYYNEFLSNDGIIEIGTTSLTCQENRAIETSITNSNGNEGFIVVSDDFANKYGQVDPNSNLVGNYSGNKEASEDKFMELLQKYNDPETQIIADTKIELSATGVGTSAMFTFLGLYLGIVFAIASGTVLAIEQLSEASDNKERYRIINQLGASKKMANRSLLVQIGIMFIFPLTVALVHSFVALNEINYLISSIVNINIADNIIITTLFIVIAYGGYYLATYLASNRIINE